VSSSICNHKMEDHNMGVKNYKNYNSNNTNKQRDRQTNKKNLKGMSYDSTDHSAQFLAKNICLDEEINNLAASSRSFLH